MISAREHCIPAYDELSRLRKVAPIPSDLDNMEEKTAGGIVNKLHAVVNSEYFKNLPNNKEIRSGIYDNFLWNKSEVIEEERRIWGECVPYL